MSQILESPKVIPKTFVPNPEMMKLADQIRNLKSTQITGQYTFGRDNMRCVMGALAVEYGGAEDSMRDIIRVLNTHGMFSDDRKYKYSYDEAVRGSTSFMYERRTMDVSISVKLMSQNDTGRSFAEIADWVELEAYHHGEWK